MKKHAPARNRYIRNPMTDQPPSFENTSVAAVLAQRSRETRDELLDDLVVMLSAILPNVQIDRTLLRVAVYELLERSDVPTGAIISEAVELAKRFSTDESGRFVNGVLGSVAAAVRS